ncbi:MAG: tetratricopeptide repeat protein [Treponema sp.]|nr:tetratricopeptide repeat protein [Treponema sp.]
MKKKLSDYEYRLRWKRLLQATVAGVCIVILFLGGGFLIWHIREKFVNDRISAQELWESGAYKDIFDISGTILEETPLDYEMLILRGFSAYQLALAQITISDKAVYIEKSIQYLRKALLVKTTIMDGAIQYVLGKAYYGKGAEYAGLAVQSLEFAKQMGFSGDDMNEYLGIAYAALRDYRMSVAALTEALNSPRGEGHFSDALLLSIANSYIALDDFNMAIAYLMRCLDISKDDNAKRLVRFKLGDIYFKQEDYSAAENQYTAILKDFGENADSHYWLGEINAARNNQIQARAEWRKAVQIDPTHRSARSRLTLR